MRLWTLFFAAALAVNAQVAAEANKGYQTEEDRARVARGLEDPEREARQKPRELLAEIGLKPGDVVADIGGGPGFMLRYFIEEIGPEGKIYAQDIQQDFLDKVKEKKAANNWRNVETILGEVSDPKLPAGKVDLAFILDAYHHFDHPAETLAHIRKSLKPDGRLALIDFYRSRPHPTMSPERLQGHIRKDKDGFREEVEAAGFEFEREFDHLPHQYVLIFTNKAD